MSGNCPGDPNCAPGGCHQCHDWPIQGELIAATPLPSVRQACQCGATYELSGPTGEITEAAAEWWRKHQMARHASGVGAGSHNVYGRP